MVAQVVAALFALVGEQRVKAVQVRDEGLERELGVHWVVVVEHGCVGVLRELAEHQVVRLVPDLRLGVAQLLVAAFDHDPFDDQALQHQGGAQDATQGDVDDGLERAAVRPYHLEVHVTEWSSDLSDGIVNLLWCR